MKNKSDKALSVFRVMVERDRVVTERRTVRVTAYTATSAKMMARQRRPADGWVQVSSAQNQNSASTTVFGASRVELIGPAAPLPDDPVERHRRLNDSSFVLKMEGEELLMEAPVLQRWIVRSDSVKDVARNNFPVPIKIRVGR